jgi:hypothetical protein
MTEYIQFLWAFVILSLIVGVIFGYLVGTQGSVSPAGEWRRIVRDIFLRDNYTCYDTDGGFNVWERGCVNASFGQNGCDYCRNNITLVEYYCSRYTGRTYKFRCGRFNSTCYRGECK